MSEAIELVPLIVPTVLIPLTFLSVGISVVATFIAGLFGIKLKAEGPKQLLEVLLKPRILFSALLLNMIFLTAYKTYRFYSTKSAFVWLIQKKHQAVPSTRDYVDYKNIVNSFQEAPLKIDLQKKIEVHQVWEKKLKAGVFRSPVFSGGSLFFGAKNAYVYELESSDGSLIRDFYIGTSVTPTGIIYKNNFYIGEGEHDTHHARIYKIDLKSGEHLANFETKGHTEASPYIVNYDSKDYLLSGSGVDGLHVLDPNTMKALWTQNPGHIDSSVLVSEGKVFVGTGREKNNAKKVKAFVASYDLKTGKEIWKKEVPLSIWMKPVLSGKLVCFAMGEIYFKSNMGMLGCYDKLTGQSEFGILTKAPLMGVPLSIGEDIIINDLNGTVCRIDMSKKERRWCFETGAKEVQITSAVFDQANGVLSVLNSKTGIFFLKPNDGSLISHYFPKKKETAWGKTYASPRPVPGGWIVVDMEGVVRKLSLVEI